MEAIAEKTAGATGTTEGAEGTETAGSRTREGIIFDLKEFALNDGKGIRTTVFFKGCPLRCQWCHNPEGLSPHRELYLRRNGCTGCGLCRKPCTHPDCRGLGRCLHVCPQNLVRAVGETWDVERLAARLLRDADIYRRTNGGVTFSGGEPLLQWRFACALADRLRGAVHRTLETCGYASGEAFAALAERCDFIYMDLKLMDGAAHKKYTGVDNDVILRNARWLRKSGIPHAFRTPCVPGVTDTRENLDAIAAFVGGDAWEFLPYNTLAPAKYAAVGRTFSYVPPTPARESAPDTGDVGQGTTNS